MNHQRMVLHMIWLFILSIGTLYVFLTKHILNHVMQPCPIDHSLDDISVENN